MAAIDWTAAGDHDPERLAQARTQLVSAAQWLARVERSYVDRDGDAPFSLRWSDDRKALATHKFADGIGLELQLDRLVMQFTEGEELSDHEIDVDERSPAHIEAWILIELLHRGVDRDRFSKDLPYDTSRHLNGDGVEFSPSEYTSELAALAAVFRAAVESVARASSDPSAVRISPQDLCVEGANENGKIGFSLGTDSVAEPHFFVGEGASTGSRTLPLSATPERDAAGAVASFLAAGGAPTKH